MTMRWSRLAWALSLALACTACGSGRGGSTESGTDTHAADARVEEALVEVRGDAPPDTSAPDFGMLGPYQVGIVELDLYDDLREREVRTLVWYPALPDGQVRITYLLFVEGGAFIDAPADLSDAPYPTVVFSHGFNGVAEQSLTYTEHLASHGFLVIAPDHVGNTIKDANADDEEVAAAALLRPGDLRFAHQEVAALSASPGHLLSGMADTTHVALAGHSFGGYAALMAAGGGVDVDAARAACDAGTPADIFCPYIPFWPPGETIVLEDPFENLEALIVLAPGGSAAFGEEGLAGIQVPALVFGGSLDETTPMDIEVHPIYQRLPSPKAEVVIQGAVHLSFTNICDIPIAAAALEDFCGVAGMRGADETFPVVNTVATAFLDAHLRSGDPSASAAVLSQEGLDALFPGVVHWSKEPDQ